MALVLLTHLPCLLRASEDSAVCAQDQIASLPAAKMLHASLEEERLAVQDFLYAAVDDVRPLPSFAALLAVSQLAWQRGGRARRQQRRSSL